LARKDDIPLHLALDRVAIGEGFGTWSLLAAKSAETLSADGLLARLESGDLLLIGARPGHGKTLLSLQLAVEAMKAGRPAVFFTLEYTARDVLGRFRVLGVDPGQFEALFSFDDSEAISADHIMRALAKAPRGHAGDRRLSATARPEARQSRARRPDQCAQGLCGGEGRDTGLHLADRPFLRSRDETLPGSERYPPAEPVRSLAVQQELLPERGRSSVSGGGLALTREAPGDLAGKNRRH
jgi:hypothetical protein